MKIRREKIFETMNIKPKGEKEGLRVFMNVN